jgi:broad specificity phosphatase PhoE
MTIFYLIRHGETEWNRSGRWQGHADVPLSEEGRTQAALLARHMRAEGLHLDRIYASDLSRTLDTAQPIADAFGLPVHALPELREINVGSWSGMTRDEIVARYPGALKTVFHPPDGESREDFIARVSRALMRLAERHPDERLALVTHGGSIRGMIQFLYMLQGQDHAPPSISNTSLTEVRHDERGWHVVRFNDIGHIELPPAPAALAPQNEGATV